MFIICILFTSYREREEIKYILITNQKNQTKGQLMLIFGVFTFFQKNEQKQVNK